MEAEKPRWHRALDNLKQFTSLQARLESELSDARRELSKVRTEYLQLGVRCSALASERDALRQRLSDTDQYVDALHTGPDVAGPQAPEPGAELHRQLTSLQQEIEQSGHRYAELESRLEEDGRHIEALQDQLAAKQSREAELLTELGSLQQRLDGAGHDSHANEDKYRAVLAERDTLRLDIADTAMQHHQQIETLQQQLDESAGQQAELNAAIEARERQLEGLQEELAQVQAKLSRLQAGNRDRAIANTERDQAFEALTQRFNEERERAAQLETQLADLRRSASDAQRAHEAVGNGHRQQLALLQQRLAEVQAERDTAQQNCQALQTQLDGVSGTQDDTRTQIRALEWRLAEAAKGRDALRDKLQALDNERKQLRNSEAELNGSLKQARNQRHLAEYANDALLASRQRERKLLWSALLLVLALLALMLFRYGPPWRSAMPAAVDAADIEPGSRDASVGSDAATSLPTEPTSETAALPDADDACTQWGVAGDDCAGLNALGSGGTVIHLHSGVKYKVFSSGTGIAPRPGDGVVLNYTGRLLDGTEFDSSQWRGGTANLHLDALIPGLQEALQRMEEGARWVVYVPPELGDPEFDAADGEAVVFDIELIAVGDSAETTSEFAAVQWAEEAPGAVPEPGEELTDAADSAVDVPALVPIGAPDAAAVPLTE